MLLLSLMKQQRHNSVSNKNKKTAKKFLLLSVSFLFATATMVQLVPSSVKADEFDERIAIIERQINDFQNQASSLKDQADSLQKELNALSAQRNVIQGQIDLKQAEYEKLLNEITITEKKISDNQEALGDTLADLYIESDISPLEMLASSSDLSDYVDKEAYRNSIKDSIFRTIQNIKDFKQELEIKKKDVERVIAEQKLARDALVEKENQQATLVEQTRGEEAAYVRLVNEREGQKLELQRQQQAAIEAASRRAGGSVSILPGDPNKGGYPWEAGCWLDGNAWSYGGAYGNGTDPLGYGCRQCVSYTAWKVGQRTGNYPRYWGNANMWPASARSAGYSTGSVPRVNSVGVISAGVYGHVVWVEAVNGDGTVDISQYNYLNAGGSGWGHYSKMRVSAATYDTYIYF
jgi:surface antigen/peptidoglycan hydrolase CwlO-like protein